MTNDPAPPGTLRTRMPRNVEGNARLTALTAAVLFLLLAGEGVTILQVQSLLRPHVVIGMILIPPVLVKMGSTGWRFVQYYRGDAEYRRKGPPNIVMRLLGPVVVVLTVVVLASGVALIAFGSQWRSSMMLLHKASFVLWLGAMTVHVLGHLVETAKLAPADWMRRSRVQVRGASLRQWITISSLAVGVLLAIVVVPQSASYFGH